MAPRNTARVKIVSPNSGNVTLSRSASLHSARGHGTDGCATAHSSHSSAPCSPTFGRQALANLSTNSNGSYGGHTSGKDALRGICLNSHRHSNARAGDQDAIQRAQDALEAAGRNVLKRPFGGHANGKGATASDSKANAITASTASSGSRAMQDSAFASSNQNSGNSRSLQLPQSILGLYRRRSASRSTFADTSRDSSTSRKRPRSVSGAPTADHINPSRRTEQQDSLFLPRGGNGRAAAPPASYASASLAAAVNTATNAPSGPPPPIVCPGMFSGLSAISLSAKLFDSAEQSGHANYYPGPGAEAEADEHGIAASSKDFCPRRCVRPLWSLVGTFKTALTSVVNVDYGNDCLNWQQRSPKGGLQRIRVPLHAVLDAVVARITQEDEDIKERQFTVIVRTSARPSQVVFGFKSTREANEFRSMVRPRGM